GEVGVGEEGEGGGGGVGVGEGGVGEEVRRKWWKEEGGGKEMGGMVVERGVRSGRGMGRRSGRRRMMWMRMGDGW
ncbi:hypothetical protein, partial [Cellulosimicrobium sp. TH-20]|uniref:hypothetical protein n=1 Tax=Cellulosimicrobium sp. TH-20 TaxID=1980001 RepID=UPI001C991F47